MAAPSLANLLTISSLLLLALTGCDGGDKSALLDADEDGYTEDVDCDEADPAVNPAAAEICDDIDNNCDAAVDNNPTDGRLWYRDLDEDTYGDPATEENACSKPQGYVADNTDCDDDDAAVSPAGDEICDDVDNDCDGTVDNSFSDGSIWYADADGDGYGDAITTTAACDEPTGFVDNTLDCDDTDSDISPDAAEECDSIDNDCDTFIDEGDAVGALTWYLDSDGDGYGDPAREGLGCTQPSSFVDNADDCDDSDADAYPGGTESWHDSSDGDCDGKDDPIEIGAEFNGATASDRVGWSVDAAGDVDGDGLADAIIGGYGDDTGARDAGAAWLLLGGGALEVGGDPFDMDDADAEFTGGALSDSAGYGVSGALDVDGDGYDDLLVGATGEDTATTSAGAVYLVYADNALGGGVMSLSDADLMITGINSSDQLGSAVVGLGDVDGDGKSDIAVGSLYFDRTGNSSGAAWLMLSSGALTTTRYPFSINTYDARIDGEGANDQMGYRVAKAGDVDGDGLADMLVSAPYDDTTATSSGAVYLLLGGGSLAAGGGLADTDADTILLGATASDTMGVGLGGGEDVNGDGLADAIMGSAAYSSQYGIAYIVYSSGALLTRGQVSLSTAADLRVEGEASTQQLGFAVDVIPDADGDTLGDLLIGVPGDTTAASKAGGAWYLSSSTAISTSGGTMTASDCDILFEGPSANAAAGYTLAGLGDTNGDGTGDVLIGAPSYGTSSSSALGAAWLLRF